jgi:adenylate cyclase
VYGGVGTDAHREFLAVGETVNVAARLQSSAEPMTALISAATRRLLPVGFEVVDVGPVEVRGLDTPVGAFVPRRAPADLEASGRTMSFASPMVGREAELDQLVDATREGRAGAGRVVLLVGEPGVGKSRLVREWRARVADHGLRWTQASMPAYASGEAYRLAAEAMRAIIGIGPLGEADDLDAALERMPRAAGIDGARRHLADLLSIPLPESDEAAVEPLSPQGRQARYIELVRAAVRDVASEPLIVVLNDAHWSDPASVSLLTPLLALHAELPLLVCITTRPDTDTPGWRLASAARSVGGRGLLEISLETLLIEGVRELLANLLVSDDVPRGLVDFVHARTDGNPLFVEEVVRMLIDSELLVRSSDGWHFDPSGGDQVPETLQALLAARIDRLDAEARMTLRIASVIGRQFAVPVLERMLKWSS